MYTKIAAFGLISALLVAAIYSSSAYFVFGVTDTVCVETSKTNTFCQVIENDKVVGSWDCKKNPDGKTWRCDQVKAITGDSIPPELTDALDIAIGESQNTTKVPKSGFLDDGADLTQGDTSDDNDDTGVPEDRGGLNEDDDGAPTINPGQ